MARMGNSSVEPPNRLRQLLFTLPGLPRLAGWRLIGRTPGQHWWGYGQPQHYPKSKIATERRLEQFRECVAAFCRTIGKFDTEGDPDYYRHETPRLDIEGIVVYDELIRVDRSGWLQWPDLVPKRGFLKRREGGIIYLSEAGLVNTRVLFEEAAHGHKRLLRSGGRERFECHLDIFLAFQSTGENGVYGKAPEKDQESIDRSIVDLGDGRCDLRRGYRLKPPVGCECIHLG